MFLKTFGKGTSNKDKTSGIVISSPVNFKDSKSEKSQIYPMVTLDKSFSKKRYILPERGFLFETLIHSYKIINRTMQKLGKF